MKRKPTQLTAEQLAALLNISEFTVKKLAREKQIPCEYINKRPIFSMDKIVAYFRKLEGGTA
jgi:L-arabinose isomerase